MESKKRNEELYYTARDLAVIFNNLALDCQSEAEILGHIWTKERAYLREPYRSDRRRLYLDTLYWESYYYHKDSFDEELKTISKDCRDAGGSLKEADYMSDFADVDLFFKTLRIRLLYGPGGAYVRLKRRTLLSQLNAQRLRPQVAQRIQTCLRFYRIGMFSRGEIPCRLEETKPDDLIVLRIVAKKPSVQKARPGK